MLAPEQGLGGVKAVSIEPVNMPDIKTLAEPLKDGDHQLEVSE
jgi:hypothetical protein